MEKVECIVVGGGLGLSAAYGPAGAGARSAAERGDYLALRTSPAVSLRARSAAFALSSGRRCSSAPSPASSSPRWATAPTPSSSPDRLVADPPQSYTVARADSQCPPKVARRAAWSSPAVRWTSCCAMTGVSRHPRRRGRDRRPGRDRRGGRAAAAQQRGRPRAGAAGQAPRARLQGDHRAAGGRDRGPLAPQPRRGRRPVLHGRVHQGHDGRRLPLHQQGDISPASSSACTR
jgi:hypothetical protein